MSRCRRTRRWHRLWCRRLRLQIWHSPPTLSLFGRRSTLGFSFGVSDFGGSYCIPPGSINLSEHLLKTLYHGQPHLVWNQNQDRLDHGVLPWDRVLQTAIAEHFYGSPHIRRSCRDSSDFPSIMLLMYLALMPYSSVNPY